MITYTNSFSMHIINLAIVKNKRRGIVYLLISFSSLLSTVGTFANVFKIWATTLTPTITRSIHIKEDVLCGRI